MPGLLRGGSLTPSGTPFFRTSKYWESGSLASSAIDRRWSRKNGCPSKGVSWWEPGTSDLTCANRAGGKGWCLSWRWIDSSTLSTTLVASPRIFFPKSTSDGAGFLKGGGDLPGLGFPPPSRSGRTLKARRTITVWSNKACSLDTGVVDGRSTTTGAGTSPVGCRLLALTSRGAPDPCRAMCWMMAVLRPCIISGGYRLKSDEFIPGARSCFSWVQCRPCEWCSGRSVAKTVDLTADCPSSHSSKCIKVRPIVLHHACTAWVCHMVEHRLALGLVEHSLGSSGSSKKHQGRPGPLYLIFEMWLRSSCLSKSRLSLSVSFASEASRTEKPQQSGLLQVRQFGPPPVPCISPFQAETHSWE